MRGTGRSLSLPAEEAKKFLLDEASTLSTALAIEARN
jgi:hypothetical protein